MSKETKSTILRILGGAAGMLLGSLAWKVMANAGWADHWCLFAFTTCFISLETLTYIMTD